jgi:hypothetical protein
MEYRVMYRGFELERERETATEAPAADEAARLKREYAAESRAARTRRTAERRRGGPNKKRRRRRG